MRVLHLEDSSADAELIGVLIRREWPGCRISHVGTASDYRTALETGQFDVILSDYSIPGYDGPAALALARASCPETPFLFLSGTIGEERAVEALKQGATDYVIKDRPKRLVPAIRQAMKRVEEGRRRRQMEEALRQNEERFRQITENVAELIAVLDLDGRRLYVNPAYCEALGDAATLLGSDSFREVHPVDRLRVRAAFEETVQKGGGQWIDFRLLLPDGRIRHVESHSSALRDATGRVASVLQVSRDVTERRRAEARLREQATLLDKARDAILATDMEHRVTHWNASAERLYGWTAAEVVGRRLDELGLGFEPARFAAARSELLETGEWRGEFRLRTKVGATVLVESTWSLVVENDQPRSILAIDTDITERRMLETQLLRAQRMESIGTLAGGVAHDLNNVFTPIMLTLELLKTKVPADELDLIEQTKACATHGAALVRQLLTFARGAEAKRARIDPLRALRELRPLIAQALPANVSLVVKTDEMLWPIDADVTQFNQALLNLCINARDALPSSGGRIAIEAKNGVVEAALAAANPGARPGPCVCVSVVDNGSGIPGSIIDKIFDPFFTTKAAGKGTGLGLSVVSGILKSHGGFVQVESEPRKGTTFHLFFPAATSGPPPPRRDTAVLTGGHGEGILLIDDEPVVRETLKLVLQRAGYRVFPAVDGDSGLAEFERRNDEISLVITDMMLPDQIGTQVVKKLRGRMASLPIIAISGMMSSGEFDELLDLQPPVECLAKPLSPAALLNAVHRRLQTSTTK